MPYDIFLYLIEQNDIRGKDLISLCLSSAKINDKCNNKNQLLFRRLLERDYNIVLPEQLENYDARQEYIEQSSLKVWTFGSGYNGKLGHGNQRAQLWPKMIEGFSGIKQVSCSGYYTAFIDSFGQIWTFGSGDVVKLGYDDAKYQSLPKMIKGFKDIKQVSCGGYHTAFLKT